jgi:hypothetical protein
VHGGTAQASKSRTDAWLQTLSFMDGGTLDAQAGAWLRWNGGNIDTGSTVTVWLSRDNGQSWEAVATNQAYAAGEYFYQNTSTNDPSSLLARWRVTVDESDPLLAGVNATNFIYKNQAFEYFVNDTWSTNDVYCTASGNDANLGVSAGTPMATLSALLAKYPLGAGDRVYVDTGVYPSGVPIVFTPSHSGAVTNPVTIIGSTNRLAGGTLLGNTNGVQPTLMLVLQSGVSNLVIRDIAMTNVARGVAMTNAVNIVLDGVEVRNATSRAFDLQANSRSIELVRCVAQAGGVGVYLSQVTNVTIRHSVFLENRENAVYLVSQVGALLENSILASRGPMPRCSRMPRWRDSAPTTTASTRGRWCGWAITGPPGALADNLAAWQALTGLDALQHSGRSPNGQPRSGHRHRGGV